MNKVRFSVATKKLLQEEGLKAVVERFTKASSCPNCSLPLGEAHASLQVYISKNAGFVKAAHKKCLDPTFKEISMLPLSPETGYEFRTITLPVSQDESQGVLPALLVRLSVDVVVLFKDPRGNWDPAIDSRLATSGFGPAGGQLPYAYDPVHCSLIEAEKVFEAPLGVEVHMPGGEKIRVLDQDFAMNTAKANGVLVLVLAKGDVSEVNDLVKLQEVLKDPEMRLALVPLVRAKKENTDEGATSSAAEIPE